MNFNFNCTCTPSTWHPCWLAQSGNVSPSKVKFSALNLAMVKVFPRFNRVEQSQYSRLKRKEVVSTDQKTKLDPNMSLHRISPAPLNSADHCCAAAHSEAESPPEFEIGEPAWKPDKGEQHLQGKAKGVWEGVGVPDNEGAWTLTFQQVDRVLPCDVRLVPPLVVLLHLHERHQWKFLERDDFQSPVWHGWLRRLLVQKRRSHVGRKGSGPPEHLMRDIAG